MPPYSTSWNTTIHLNGTHFIKVIALSPSGSQLGEDDTSVMVSNSNPAATPTRYYGTLPAGASLPSQSTCTSAVRSKPSSEGIPANAGANETIPTSSELSEFHSQPLWSNEIPASDFSGVTGNFTGTTDQMFSSGACKWGVDENAMRAEAWEETFWKQSTQGDMRTSYSLCHTPNWDGWNGSKCWQSYGMFQAKVYDYNVWSEIRDSTAFNTDFRGAYIRACINGHIDYLNRVPAPEPGYPTYSAANSKYKFWGCMGQWASGGWFDVGAIEYITDIQMYMARKPWPKVSSSTSTSSTAVTISAPANGSTVSGSVDIQTSISSSVRWENVYVDGHYFESSPPDYFHWNSSTVPNGSHTISARAYGSGGGQIGSTSISVDVKN